MFDKSIYSNLRGLPLENIFNFKWNIFRLYSAGPDDLSKTIPIIAYRLDSLLLFNLNWWKTNARSINSIPHASGAD